MNVFFWKNVPRPETVAVEAEANEITRRAQRMWWEVFSDVLKMGVEDGETLVQLAQPERLKAFVDGAVSVANAALDAYEERFAGMGGGDGGSER